MWWDTEVLSACMCVLQGWSGASVAYAVGAAVSGDGYTILQPDSCEVTESSFSPLQCNVLQLSVTYIQ